MILEIAIRRVASAAVLDLAGRVTAGEGSLHLASEIRSLADQGCRNLILNFDHVAFLDSAGLGALVVAAEQLRPLGGALRIVNARGPVQRVLQITRLDRVFPHFDDEEAALASFPG
jgi:anti-sigma B factor antagonist